MTKRENKYGCNRDKKPVGNLGRMSVSEYYELKKKTYKQIGVTDRRLTSAEYKEVADGVEAYRVTRSETRTLQRKD